MEIRSADDAGILTLALEGEFDATQVPAFSDEVSRLLTPEEPRLMLDLQAVSFMDSTAIQSVLEVEQRLTGQGGGVAIIKPRSFVEKVLRLLELGRRIPIVETREEARERLLAGE